MKQEYYSKLRVLRHELGHFVAQQLNKQLYGGEDTEYIRITRKQNDDKVDYEGETGRKNYDKTALLKDPAALIASIAYGCLFQCALYGNQLDTCLASRQVNGEKDWSSLHQAIYESTGGTSASWKILEIINKHLESVRNNDEFLQIPSINVDDLISSNNEEFFVDLATLHERFNFIFPLHTDTYKEFVTALNEVLKKSTVDS